MNGWTALIVFLVLLAATTNPIKAQISCALGVEPACQYLGGTYRD